MKINTYERDTRLNTVEAAVLWAMRTAHVAFWGNGLARLKQVVDNAQPTAMTNGRLVKWNTDFVAKLTPPQVRYVVLHEVLHCLLRHFFRLPHNALGNAAGDYEINLMLEGVWGIERPPDALYDVRFKGMPCEQIYLILQQEQPPPPPPPPPPPRPRPPEGEDGQGRVPTDGKGKGKGEDEEGEEIDGQGRVPTDGKGKGKGEEPIDTGGCGGFEGPDPEDPESTSPEKLEEEWRQELIKSKIIQSSLKRGDIPASAQREIDRINSVRVDWRNAMTEFVRSLPSGRNDWTRSARRHALAPTIVPRRKRDEVGLVVYVRDVSGSVADKVFAEFTGLIGQACENTGGDAIVIDADAAVQAEYRITRGDLVPTTGTGGGGTDFRPAFVRVQELIDEGENIAGVVYLTDLYGTQPEPDMVTVPTLWLVTNDQVATTGTTVQVHL
ncbi:MAG: hypothetical protein JW395_2925 [Nitrospira sp.]|nr:hypothetical protein [Nitrospira sp.]